MTHTLDALTRMVTAFASFDELVNGTAPDYFPTLLAHGTKDMRDERMELADAYDAAMIARGDARRAWRGLRHRPAAVTKAA